jgi:hypothetical protein
MQDSCDWTGGTMEVDVAKTNGARSAERTDKGKQMNLADSQTQRQTGDKRSDGRRNQ